VQECEEAVEQLIVWNGLRCIVLPDTRALLWVTLFNLLGSLATLWGAALFVTNVGFGELGFKIVGIFGLGLLLLLLFGKSA